MAFRSTDLMIDADVREAASKKKKGTRIKCKKACSRTNQQSRCKAGTNTTQFSCTSSASDEKDFAMLMLDLKRLRIEAANAA